jgi:hypothetical protein
MPNLAKNGIFVKQSFGPNRSQRIIKRPMILPAQVDLVAPALVADAGGEAHVVVRILVRGRGVDHAGADVAGFVIGDKPARVETLGEL